MRLDELLRVPTKIEKTGSADNTTKIQGTKRESKFEINKANKNDANESVENARKKENHEVEKSKNQENDVHNVSILQKNRNAPAIIKSSKIEIKENGTETGKDDGIDIDIGLFKEIIKKISLAKTTSTDEMDNEETIPTDAITKFIMDIESMINNLQNQNNQMEAFKGEGFADTLKTLKASLEELASYVKSTEQLSVSVLLKEVNSLKNEIFNTKIELHKQLKQITSEGKNSKDEVKVTEEMKSIKEKIELLNSIESQVMSLESGMNQLAYGKVEEGVIHLYADSDSNSNVETKMDKKIEKKIGDRVGEGIGQKIDGKTGASQPVHEVMPTKETKKVQGNEIEATQTKEVSSPINADENTNQLSDKSTFASIGDTKATDKIDGKAIKLPEVNLEQLKQKVNDKIEHLQKMYVGKDKILVQLSPKDLGTVEVFFKKSNEGIEISIEAHTKEAKQKLEVMMDDFKKEFRDRNIDVNFSFKEKEREREQDAPQERKKEFSNKERKVEVDDSFDDLINEILGGN